MSGLEPYLEEWLGVLITVGVAELKVSRDRDATLVTHSLGSCVGVAVYDPIARIAGLLHCQLPLSSLDPYKAEMNPAMFADTGVIVLLRDMLQHGAERRRLVARLAGAASLLDDQRLFRIGERNHRVAKRVLEKNGIRIAREDVGGSVARTIYLTVADGRTQMRSNGQLVEL